MVTLKDLLESNYEDLLASNRISTGSPALDYYRNVLLAFLKGDRERCLQLSGETAFGFRAELALLRHQIMTRSVKRELIETLIIQGAALPDWEGEVLIACAHAFETLRELEPAKKTYLAAHDALLKMGCERKALRAYMNSIAMEGQLHPEKRQLEEFHAIYRKAKKLREYRTCGIALSNIAREYRNIRALTTALQFANSAVRYLKKEMGSVFYYKALTNRCHILFELGRDTEAKLDLEAAAHAQFPEIRSALLVIQQLMNPHQKLSIPEESLLPIWKERLAEGRLNEVQGVKHHRQKLSELEEALIRYLQEGPRDKFELIEFLYGRKLNIDSTEARLKSLLTRFRKKCPGLIQLLKGKYEITNQALLPQNSRKAG
ncbi:MAG: hypothetical protein NDJ90_00210 [Oligoflexia bacterium]|nr:hypothetical protein [Oligoflexia bacterium]